MGETAVSFDVVGEKEGQEKVAEDKKGTKRRTEVVSDEEVTKRNSNPFNIA